MPRKRASGDGALYFVPKLGIWKGVVDVGYWPDGRRKQKAVSSKSQAIARKKLEALKTEIAQYGAPLDKQTKVSMYAAEWLETVSKPTNGNVATSTYGNRKSILKTWIIPTIGNRIVSTLKPPDVRAVARAVKDAGRSSSTARKAYDILSLMLESARRDGLCTRNVAEDVTPPRMAISGRGALDPDVAMEILKTAASDPLGTRWWVSLLLGVRQGERLGARIDSLDLDAGTFRVEWALEEVTSSHGCGAQVNGKWPCGLKRGGSCSHRVYNLRDGEEHVQVSGQLWLIPPKSGKTRIVPLVAGLVEALRRHLAATAHIPNPHGLIWRHDDGTPFLPTEDQEAWRDLLARSGVQDVSITSHWARHTTATILMELGVDAKVIGEIVGHASVDMTRKHYQHVSSAVAREAMDRLGARLIIESADPQ